jgi:hypothetical protein
VAGEQVVVEVSHLTVDQDLMMTELAPALPQNRGVEVYGMARVLLFCRS